MLARPEAWDIRKLAHSAWYMMVQSWWEIPNGLNLGKKNKQ